MDKGETFNDMFKDFITNVKDVFHKILVTLNSRDEN